MDGAGIGIGNPEPPSSMSLWGDAFGLGGLFKTLTDPNLGLHAVAMMRAIAEGAAASRRIEDKLDTLLKALGHDEQRLAVAAILIADGTDGTGRPSASSGAVDGGNRGAAAHNRIIDGTASPPGQTGL